MISQLQYENAQQKAAEYMARAGIVITDEEFRRIEVLDFGFGEPEKMGLQILVYINTPRVCAKEMVLFPRQTCAEHIHPTRNGTIGKEEVFRCRWGTCFLHIQGAKTENCGALKPAGHEAYLTCASEIKLNPGDQYTLSPDTWHWFQAGEEGAVISEFSSTNTDEYDEFTDKRIHRFTEITKNP